MSAIVITTGCADNYDERIAATLIQEPRYIDHADKNWSENAELIAAFRNAASELVRLARLGLEAETRSQKN